MARGRSGERAASTLRSPAAPAHPAGSASAGDWLSQATVAPARPDRGRRYRRALLRAGALAGVAGAAWLAAAAPAAGATYPVPKDPGRGPAGPASLNAYKDVFGVGAISKAAPRVKLRWPLKPFNRAHQLRATFGEPRSVRMDRLGLKGYDWHAYLYTLNQVGVPGPRSIHDGIDIVARQGTPVYSLENGRAILGGNGKYARWVRVGNYRYDHITQLVKPGQKVVAFKTVIGRIATPDHHLHLTRSYKGRSINQLSHGGFVGFKDTAPPRLKEVSAYAPDGSLLDMNNLRGKVAMTIHMDDLLSQGGAGVGVYSYGYRIEAEGGGVVYSATNYRAGEILPAAAADVLYTPATNRNDFDHDFWYRLTLRSPSGDGFLDTDALAPGRYKITVIAKDASGNASSASYPFGVTR